MKLKTLFLAAAALFVSAAVSAQVVVNSMPKGSAQEDYFKAYENVTIGGTADWKAQGDYQFAQLSADGKYMAVTADKKIKAIRLFATGNSQNASFNPSVIGFAEVPEEVDLSNKSLLLVDFAQAYDAKAGRQQFEEAVWIDIDLSEVDLKAVYISRQWKKIATDPEDTKGATIGATSQTVRIFGFHVVLDGEELPEIPEGPVVVEDPAITKVTVAGVEAVIDNSKKTITAELPFGTDLAEALAAAEIEDNQEDVDPVLDAEAMTLTLGELVYTLNITVAEDPDAPSTNVLLTEAIFSNGVKAFIDNKNGANTVTVPYLGEKPTLVSGQNEDGKAKVSAEGDKIIVENGEAKAEYALSLNEYSVAPLEVGAEPYVFTGEEIGTWIASVYGWDAEKGIKFAKDVEEEGNRRISEGKDRVILFLPAADSVRLVSGAGQNRPVTITVNGVVNEVNKTAKTGEAISVALGNVPALLAVESTGSNGDGGFTSIQLVKAGETPQPQPETPAITKVTVAGVEAVIDQENKKISVILPWDADLEAALQDVVIEDNQDEVDPVIDIEAQTITLGEVVYSVEITLAEKPVDPQPAGNHEVIADFVGGIGTFTAVGTCTVENDVMKFANSFNKGANYFSVEPYKYETFVKGDTLYISFYKTNSDESKSAKIEIFNNLDESLFLTDQASTETATQMFILESSTSLLKLGRSGNTGIFVSDFKVHANSERVATSLNLVEAGAEISVINSTLYVNCANASNIQVYTIDGRMIDSKVAANYTRSLSTGVYVVRVNNEAVKAIVK